MGPAGRTVATKIASHPEFRPARARPGSSPRDGGEATAPYPRLRSLPLVPPALATASSLPSRPAGPNDPPRAPIPTQLPSELPGLHVFSPSTEMASRWAHAREGGSMGSEWGLRPLRVGSTTAEVSAIHWFAASRLRRRRHPRHRRLARASQRRSAATPGTTVKDASRTSDETAPNPGTSCEARSEKTEGRRAHGRRVKRDRSRKVHSVDDREAMPALERRRRVRPAAEEACAAAMKEVSTGTN